MNQHLKNPKELYKSLKIHRSVINKQLQCLDYSFAELRFQLRKYLAYIDLQIQDYDQFFKTRQDKIQENRLELLFEDVEYK